MNERLPFWSDDFDMDLLKVFPQVPKMLREPGRILWTVGHMTLGRLNHPTCWNSHGAFVWLKKPNLERDKNGWFNVGGCVSDEAEVECTWLEFLRDAWIHTYGAVILPSRKVMPSTQWTAFEQIMYDLRGWHKRDVSEARRTALNWVLNWDFILYTDLPAKEGAEA